MRRLLRAAVGLVAGGRHYRPNPGRPPSQPAPPAEWLCPGGHRHRGGTGCSTPGHSLAPGIWRGDLRTGKGALIVEGGGPFVGMKVDGRNRLWVAGGPAGNGYVFNAATGRLKAMFSFASAPTFINDVVVTRRAAYFTDPSSPPSTGLPSDREAGSERRPPSSWIRMTLASFPAPSTSTASSLRHGRPLPAVGELDLRRAVPRQPAERQRPHDRPGRRERLGRRRAPQGATHAVCRPQRLNLVAVVRLAARLLAGRMVNELTARRLDFPTTAALFAGSLYLANARFSTAGHAAIRSTGCRA